MSCQTASTDLHRVFAEFLQSPSLFCLPVTIEREHLVPLSQDAVGFSSTSSDFASNLPKLKSALSPNQAVYLILRRSQDANAQLTAVTYIPSTAPVRQKTLYASTRATLTRELGVEKFGNGVFATEAEEITDPKQWEEREAHGEGKVDQALLSNEERELQGVKRAEEEERHGTARRDLMGGTVIAGASKYTSYGDTGNAVPDESSTAPVQAGGGSAHGVHMNVDPSARRALQSMGPSGENRSGPERGRMTQLGIDLSTETLMLITSAPCLDPDEVTHSIPANKPSYTFYHYPSTGAVVFIYACPSGSKIKEKMLYATARRDVLALAESEGVSVGKRLEISEPHEIGSERLRDELETVEEPSAGAGASKGFARPKRPGKR